MRSRNASQQSGRRTAATQSSLSESVFLVSNGQREIAGTPILMEERGIYITGEVTARE
jgi:hypothetical protein